jgi:PAS domain S-box-containing protein
MNLPASSVLAPSHLWRVTWLIVLVWTLAVAASVVWNVHLLHDVMLEAAMTDARNDLNMDLHCLTNPASMTRQVHELAAHSDGMLGHITSLKPSRPENAPDAWETAALRAFEHGQTEVISREPFHGQRQLRFMKPLVTEAACLACHAGQGYKVGDIGGGISVAAPLDLYMALAQARIGPIAMIHAGLWALGMLGIFLGARQMRQRLDQKLRAEETLRQSEARYRAVADSANDAIITADGAGNIVGWNQGAERIFGYMEAEILGQPLTRLMPHGYRDPHTEGMRRVTAGGARHIIGKTVELEGLRKDGSAFPLELSLADWQADAGHFYTGIIRDITRRRRSEESLRLQSAALEAAANAIVITDHHGTIQSVNSAFTALTGYTAQEVVGQNPRILRGGNHDEAFYRNLWQTISSGQVWSGELTNRRKDGSLYAEEMTITPLRDADGVIARYIAIKQDITARKRAAAELESIHKQLVEASRRGGMAEIATNVLHNVGNVLNSVNISTDLIVESVKKSRTSSLARVVVLLREHAHDLGEFISNDSRGKHVPAHLAQLSEHLLAEQAANVRELDSLRQNVEHIKEIVAMQQNYATFGGVKEMINVAELVEDSLRLNENALGRHDVEVIREFEAVPPLNAERHKILQVLVNLLRNAKYACQDSERADKRLTVRVAKGEGRIKISVIDNGVGIPPENLTRIFNHGFTTRKDGHGFGLHSGALAAREMGGSLTVHSDGPGLGAAFTLELPLPDAGGLT